MQRRAARKAIGEWTGKNGSGVRDQIITQMKEVRAARRRVLFLAGVVVAAGAGIAALVRWTVVL